MQTVKMNIVLNGQSKSIEFKIKLNEKTDEQALSRAAVQFYGIICEFRTSHKASDKLVMSVFNTIGDVVMNYVCDKGIEQCIDFRKINSGETCFNI